MVPEIAFTKWPVISIGHQAAFFGGQRVDRIAEPIVIALTVGAVGQWANIAPDVQVLAISGLAGAVFRAFLLPERAPTRRFFQAIAGMLSAVFLGGLAAHMIPPVGHNGIWSMMSSGFLFGAGGEIAVKRLQDRLYGGDN